MMVKPQLAMHGVLCFPQILLISFTFVCFLDLVSFSVARHRNTSTYSIKSGQSVLNLKKINNNHQTQYVSLGSSATLWSEICLFNFQLAVGELFPEEQEEKLGADRDRICWLKFGPISIIKLGVGSTHPAPRLLEIVRSAQWQSLWCSTPLGLDERTKMFQRRLYRWDSIFRTCTCQLDNWA